MSNYRKLKGDRAEMAVKLALEREGFIVRTGHRAYCGCDLP